MSADIEFDDEIRATVAATRPDRHPATGLISARADKLRRHAQYRMVALVAVIVACTAGVAYALPGGGRPGSLNVSAPQHHLGHKSTRRNTTTTSPVKGSVPTTSGGVVVPPTTAGPITTTPNVSTPTTVKGSPPTTKGSSVIEPPTTAGEAPPTTQPPPNYPPIAAGHTRIVIVLDDSGLHAPAFVKAGYGIEILFDDQRTNHKPTWELLLGGYGTDGKNGYFGIVPWNVNPNPTYGWQIVANGKVLTFYAVAGSNKCTDCAWSGTPVHITITQ